MKMNKMKLMLLADTEFDRQNIMGILKNIDYVNVIGDYTDEEAAWDSLERASAEIMLLGAGVNGEGYAFAERISAIHPELGIIMLESELLEETMHNALFSGAKDVLVKPLEPEKVAGAIYRIHQLSERKAALQNNSVNKKVRKRDLGQVYTVFSTKGGVGKTFVSINLAASLAKKQDARVVLLDLDLDFGNAALALNLYPKFTISDVVDDIRNIDSDLIESYLMPHESGIKVLPANLQQQMNDYMNAEHIRIILESLRESFDYIVVDMPARFVDKVMPALALADTLLVVTTPEISSVRNVKALLATLMDLNFPQSKVKIILNKEQIRGDIKQKDIELTLNKKVDAAIGFDYQKVLSSLNRGIPLVSEYPKNVVSKNIEKLCLRIVQDEPLKA
ncbi:AAA family ATPase [Trichococcus sp. K1Tr]|uniref:AAA family ATPase n=1 Tax=Trichococcus sp. K1Tr TaxID=3020847 RepID=UPI00232CECA1|nr:AAA family ATPase [Trichococcus sp. K1Tr]MDB6353952.1 AAA family ATPase [Trichococcus sp. K1Tr]